MKNRVLCAVLAAMLTSPAFAADLPRKAMLGVRMSETTGGVRVDEVLPGMTGAAIGLKPGDILVAAGERQFRSTPDVVAYATGLTGGDRVTLQVRRGSKPTTISGRAVPKALERYPGATSDYGAVPFRGGHLRDLLIMPTNAPDAPVVFLIQGFSCGSVEGGPATHPYRRLGEELLKRGIGYYRVEKSGMGDSLGTPACAQIDHDTELEGFRAAYAHLIDTRKIAPDRIFMFGHSLGGLQAPVLAAQRPPRGIAAYGTVVRNWADYHRNIGLFQDMLFRGSDAAEAYLQSERDRELFRLFYFERRSPAEIAIAHPEFADRLRDAFGWDGGTQVFGRDYRFDQQLAQLNVIPAWKAARTNVLAMYGESDLVALTNEDHVLLADMVNQWRPGTGRYVEIAKTEHGMTVVGDRRELRERTRASNGQPPEGEFNPLVAESLASWVRETMAKPPVAAAAPPAGS